MDATPSADLVAAWSKKMAPPLVTLLSSEPEVRGGAMPPTTATILLQLPAGAVTGAFSLCCMHNWTKLEPRRLLYNYYSWLQVGCSRAFPSRLPTRAQVQYVALRNINLIVQKRPSILANEVKVFFCKYK